MDEFDKQMEELLPCQCQWYTGQYGTKVHGLQCPAYISPDLAAALRELAERKDKEIAELKADCARISAEFGLPPTMAPANGWIAQQIELWQRAQRELEREKAEIERLKNELLRIGDMAVANWDDAVVGEVDKVVPGVTPTYYQWRRAEIAQVEAMRKEIDALKTQLADYEHLAAAYGLQAKELEQLEALRAENAELKEGLSNQARLIVAGAQSQAALKAKLAKLEESQ